jgi:hypothetical protein
MHRNANPVTISPQIPIYTGDIPSTVQSSEMDRLRKLEISRRFSRAIEQRSRKCGYLMEPECTGPLARLIRHGIERIALEKMLDNLGRIQSAEKNLAKFIDKMAQHAQSSGRYPYLNSKDYWGVKSSSLSCWPFT